ncbi:TNF receptor-associated factor 4-like [Macaca thibetana thibetana]|uniref:TNF receptor-associated factor 4-like n=1 Tax=Macaca thibetana thibetana TaxID=257877 RepID=UPI0021BC5EE1|nr:TNF receptor-associated factor 4-like [Macaca thibetana thibetana]
MSHAYSSFTEEITEVRGNSTAYARQKASNVGTVAQEDLPGHLKDSCSTALVLCSFKDSSCKHRCPKWAMAWHVEESVKPHLVMMCALLIWQWQELQDLQQELEDLSVGSDGVLIWKTGSCGQWLQEAKAKPNLECFSPAFYTQKCGYKLQVSAFLNDKGSGEGTRLSLYIDLLPGAFDNLLEWSFARCVTFCLLDQSDPGLAKPQHITDTFHPGPNWKNFQKPGTWGSSLDESSLGFGYLKFISHQDIQKRKTMYSVGNRSWGHQGLETSDLRDCLPSWVGQTCPGAGHTLPGLRCLLRCYVLRAIGGWKLGMEKG